VEDIFDLVLILNTLTNGNGPENSTASRTTLPKAVDQSCYLLIVIFSSHTGTRGRICITKGLERMSAAPHPLCVGILFIGTPLRVDHAPVGHVGSRPTWNLERRLSINHLCARNSSIEMVKLLEVLACSLDDFR
jgi:hypothetical protein